MTNNFNIIREYMIKEGIPADEKQMGDLFFVVMLVRRGKDHKNLPAANYTFKQYYFDSIEKFDKLKNEMIKCCDIFGLRAYVSVNVKSKEQLSKACSLKYAENIFNGEYKKPWMIFDHMFGKIPAKNEDRWIIDIDDVYPEIIDIKLLAIYDAINQCESKYDKKVIQEIPTKTGCHLITHPFNSKRFRIECEKRINDIDEVPEIKKNHITLLYENLDSFKND